ncbi:hypothetical protein L5515_010844 [Caenorhabditis briggsae]|uniref:Uncharacterized protein n=1 Tax=Caenorhabditis briggsae TaxID=6238 RepID=A0AAE9JGH0_CAEBR|nr:hypothetical protein L5515_010844 [Caenorhabditis briggsae]
MLEMWSERTPMNNNRHQEQHQWSFEFAKLVDMDYKRTPTPPGCRTFIELDFSVIFSIFFLFFARFFSSSDHQVRDFMDNMDLQEIRCKDYGVRTSRLLGFTEFRRFGCSKCGVRGFNRNPGFQDDDKDLLDDFADEQSTPGPTIVDLRLKRKQN